MSSAVVYLRRPTEENPLTVTKNAWRRCMLAYHPDATECGALRANLTPLEDIEVLGKNASQREPVCGMNVPTGANNTTNPGFMVGSARQCMPRAGPTPRRSSRGRRSLRNQTMSDLLLV